MDSVNVTQRTLKTGLASGGRVCHEIPAMQPVKRPKWKSMPLNVPDRLAANCRKKPERVEWLDRVPDALRRLERRWSLTLGVPFGNEDASCAWVAAVTLSSGTSAVLKLGMPHMEGEHEPHGAALLERRSDGATLGGRR
jgi:hypothetical protein